MELGFKNMNKVLQKYSRVQKINIEKPLEIATKVVLAEVKRNTKYASLKPSNKSEVIKKNNDYIGRVYNSQEHAIYVEFGTGQIGKGTYPYKTKVPLEYTSKEKWVYFNDKIGTFLTTSGMVAMPFFYPSFKISEEKAKKVFINELQKQVKKEVAK